MSLTPISAAGEHTSAPPLNEVTDTVAAHAVRGIRAKSSTSDIVELLGPGPDAKDLSSFGEDYSSTFDTLNGLLQYPFLDKMITSADGPSGSTAIAGKDLPPAFQSLRVFTIDAQSEFSLFSATDAAVSRNIASFAKAVRGILARKKTPASFMALVQKIIEENREEVITKAHRKSLALEKASFQVHKVQPLILVTF